MQTLIIGVMEEKIYKFHFSSIDELKSYWDNLIRKNYSEQNFIDKSNKLSKKEKGKINQLIKKGKRVSDFSDLIVLSDIKESELFVYFNTIIDEETMYEPFYGDKKIAGWFKVNQEELKVLQEDYVRLIDKKLKSEIVFAGSLFSKAEFISGMKYITLK